eukprot:gene7569-7070_t
MSFIDCQAPTLPIGAEIMNATECNTLYGQACPMKCQQGYEGEIKATCTEDGWEYNNTCTGPGTDAAAPAIKDA